MSRSTTTERFPSAAGPVVLTGTPVVPGVALGPVVRPSGAVTLPAGGEPAVDEAARPGRRRASTPRPTSSPAGSRGGPPARRGSVPRC